MDKYNFFILDEVSMVTDKDLEEIMDYMCVNDRKLILIGDNCQIPAPSQQLKKKGEYYYKPDSCAFSIENMYTLTQIVRQQADSPIIKLATYIRDHIYEDQNLEDILHASGVKENEIQISHKDLYKLFKKDFNDGKDTRIIAYTNSAVRSHNEQVRKTLKYNDSLIVGELLTGYTNVGWPNPYIENGTDYKVQNIRPTKSYKIDEFFGLVGNLVDIVDVDDKEHIFRNIFFIDIQNSANNKFISELIYRAEKVNALYSKKQDYKKYCDLKNRAIFLENVYKYGGKVMTETTIRELHPLLFTKISEVIDTQDRKIAKSELTAQLTDQYGTIVEERLKDNKMFADAEVFSDKYMIVEKDIYYGYSITAHKSQGSTYECVYVDEHDFKKISNKWNYKFGALEQRYKERNQLKYVAYTRASQKLSIVV
jgi:exodeoxyribonuclease-5